MVRHLPPRVAANPRGPPLPRTVPSRSAGLLLVALLVTACSSGGDGKAACRDVATVSRSAAISLFTTGSAPKPDVQPLLDAARRLTGLADKAALDAAKGPERDLAAALTADAASLLTGTPSTDNIDAAYRALRALQATCALPASRAGVDPTQPVGTFGVVPTPSP